MQLKKAVCAGPRHSCSCRLLARCPGGLDRCQRCLGRDSGMGDRRGLHCFLHRAMGCSCLCSECLTGRVYVPCAGGRKSLRSACGRQMEHSSPPAQPTSALPAQSPLCGAAFPTNGSVFPWIGRDRAGL